MLKPSVLLSASRFCTSSRNIWAKAKVASAKYAPASR